MSRNLLQDSLDYLLKLPQDITSNQSIYHILNDPKQIKKLFEVINVIDPRYVQDISTDIYGVPIRSKKNKKVIRDDAEISYDNIHLLINWGAAKNIFYFAKYFRIVNIDDGLIQIPLRDYQKTSLENFIKYPFNIMNSSRQTGKSTSISLYACWKFLFRSYNNAAILANKYKSAKLLLKRIKIGYENLPLYLQQPMTIYNVGDIEGINGSRIFTAATTADSISGESVNDLIVDEVAKIFYMLWQEFWDATLPVISSAKKKESISVILASTPLPDNHWKVLVDAAKLEGTKNWNGFHLQHITYQDIPERNTIEWREEQISKNNLEWFQQEHEAKFVTQSDIYFNNKKLDQIIIKKPITDSYINSKLKDYEDNISIYEKPKPNHVYALSFDPSEMRLTSKMNENTNFGIQIVDVTDMRKGWNQVVSINFEKEFDYLESPAIIAFLATYYNECWIIGENNKCKDILNDIRKDYEYDRVFKFDTKKEYYGYRTTKTNKPAHAKLLKILLDRDILKINDDDTLFELKKFTKSLRCQTGYSDGLVLAMMGITMILTLSSDRVEGLFGSEEEGVYIKRGKELLQLSLDINKNDTENDIGGIIYQFSDNDDLAESILESNGFISGSKGIII